MKEEDMIPFLINRIRELEKKNSELSNQIETLLNPIQSERAISLSSLVQNIEAKPEKSKPNIDKVVSLILKYGNQFV
jgi:hypothetical protein